MKTLLSNSQNESIPHSANFLSVYALIYYLNEILRSQSSVQPSAHVRTPPRLSASCSGFHAPE